MRQALQRRPAVSANTDRGIRCRRLND